MVLSPAATPPEVVARLNAAVNAAVGEERMRRRLEDLAMQTRAGGGPEAAAEWLRSETAKWTRVIRDSRITAG